MKSYAVLDWLRRSCNSGFAYNFMPQAAALGRGGGRIPFFDTAKGIFMFFVILSHSGYVPEWLGAFFNPFFLSGFFFTSGYFFLKMKDGKFDYWQKAMNLFTTIFCAYLLYWVLSFSVEHVLNKDFLFMGQLIKDIIMGKKMWFASCIVVSELLSITYFMCFGAGKKAIYAFPVISLVLYLVIPRGDYPWYCNVAFLANFYIGLGVIAKKHIGKFLAVVESVKWSIILWIVFAVLWGIDLMFVHQRIGFGGWYLHLWYFLPESVVSFLAVFCLSKRLYRNKALVFIGENSLLYYFFQNQMLKRITAPLGSCLNLEVPNAMYAFLSALIVSLLLVPVIWVVNRYVPVLGGKWKVKVH